MYSSTEDKVIFVCHVSDEGIKNGLKAGDLVKTAAVICEGNGGGRPDMAQSGGKNVTKINEAVKSVADKIGFSL